MRNIFDKVHDSWVTAFITVGVMKALKDKPFDKDAREILKHILEETHQLDSHGYGHEPRGLDELSETIFEPYGYELAKHILENPADHTFEQLFIYAGELASKLINDLVDGKDEESFDN